MSLPLLHAGRTNPGLSAALDLRFALDKSLTAYRGPTPSFSRASTGSYFDGSGVLRYANVNTILYSEQFENAYWFKSGLSILADLTVAPDGKTTADKVVENASSGIKYGTISGGFSVVSGTTYTFSAYAKDSGRYFGFATNSTAFPNAIGAVFNLTNGTISNIQANTTASIQSVGNGWYRCIITGTANASTTTNINFGISNDLNQIYPSYTGNGSSGYFLWGFQMETGSTVGTYCPTTSSANSAPRFNHTFNGTSWVSRGLLVEEQRTNLAIWSEDFTNAAWSKPNVNVSGNAVIAPDGNLTADLVYPVPGSTWAYAGIERNNGGGVAGNPMTISFFFKAAGKSWVSVHHGDGSDAAWFNISTGTIGTIVSGTPSISNVGNGWYKCSITRNIASNGSGWTVFRVCDSDGSTSVTGSGTNGVYAWGAQTENGAFPTSYIPTTSASTTRSADVCQITGSDFSGFWNMAEGSFAAEIDLGAPVTGITYYPFYFGASDTATNTKRLFYFSDIPTGTSSLYLSDGTTTSKVTTSNIPGNFTTFKAAMCYKVDDLAISLNGAAVVTDTSQPIPTGLDRLQIGSNPSANNFNGHIARLRYYRKRLPNATLQLLSEPDPTLNLQFALNKSLTPVAGPTPSFSRASTGTYFNASGVLTSASINTPRFDHVYSGGQWVSKGLLVEEQRANNCYFSNTFSNAIWEKYDSSISSSGTGPDGNTSSLLTENTANGPHWLRQQTSASVASGAGVSVTASIFVKANGRTVVGFGFDNSFAFTGKSVRGRFDLSDGSFANEYNCDSYSFTNVGNGWYRLSVTSTAVQAGIARFDFFLYNSDTSGGITYTGDGSSGVYVFGAQIEQGAFPTSYTGTTSSSVTRSADVCQITGTSFNWMWNQGEGSVAFEADTFSNSTAVARYYYFDDSATGNQIIGAVTLDATGNTGGDYVASYAYTGSYQALLLSQPARPLAKSAFGWKLNDFASSLNGAAVITDLSGSIPTGINRLALGATSGSAQMLNGHIAKLIYYPARLTNTKLQQLST